MGQFVMVLGGRRLDVNIGIYYIGAFIKSSWKTIDKIKGKAVRKI